MSWKARLKARLQKRQKQQLWRNRVVTGSAQSRLIKVAGRELLNFCSNDYLGLANHPQLIESGIAALKKWGAGSGASHLVSGHSELHEQLETTVADFVGAEKALVFSTGYMANLAIPQVFLDRHDLLLEDKLNHASLLDAAQFCNTKMFRYPHLDYQAAEKLLAGINAPQSMIVSDGVFSMDGDLAPVVQLLQISKDNGALLVIDDAHGFGVLGTAGGGVLQQNHIPVCDNVLLMGTFGKAAGNFGAFVAGDTDLIESLIQFARPYIYTTALPPSVAATSLAAIGLMKREPERRVRLLDNVRFFRECAQAAGLPLGDSSTPIQPVFAAQEGDSLRSLKQLNENLMAAGIWVAMIRPPTVPIGTARLRISLTSEHTREDIERLVGSLKKSIANGR